MSRAIPTASIVLALLTSTPACGWLDLFNCDDNLFCSGADIHFGPNFVGIYPELVGGLGPGNETPIYYDPQNVVLRLHLFEAPQDATAIVSIGLFPFDATSVSNYGVGVTMIEFSWPATSFMTDLTHSEIDLNIVTTYGGIPITDTVSFSTGTSDYALFRANLLNANPAKIVHKLTNSNKIFFVAPNAKFGEIAQAYDFQHCYWEINGQNAGGECISKSIDISDNSSMNVRLVVGYKNFSVSSTEVVNF